MLVASLLDEKPPRTVKDHITLNSCNALVLHTLSCSQPLILRYTEFEAYLRSDGIIHPGVERRSRARIIRVVH